MPLHYITSPHITLYHIISHHITSYHIISYHIISYVIIGFSSHDPTMLYYQSEREHSYVQNRLSILYSQAERPCLSTGKGVFVAGSPSWAGRCKNLISYIYQLKRPLEMDVALRLKLFTMRTMRALCTLERVDVRSRFQINTVE